MALSPSKMEASFSRLAVNDNIEQWKELLARNEQALLTLDDYMKAAKEAADRTKYHVQRMERANSELQLISAELKKQQQVMTRLLAQLKSRHIHLETVMQSCHEEEAVRERLRTIFARLKGKAVDPKLTNEEEGRCLYDFVDSDAVESLMRQAAEATEILKMIYRKFKDTLSVAERDVQSYMSSSTTTEFRVQYWLESVHEKVRQQDSELQAMSTSLFEVASQHDRVKHTLKQLQGVDRMSSSLANADYQTEEKKTDDVLPKVSLAYQSVQRIMAIKDEVDGLSIKYQDAYQSSVQSFQHLERFGPDLQVRMTDIEELQYGFDENETQVRRLLEELRNLAAWYEYFETAYAHLIQEIRRRLEAHKTQQQLVNELQQRLDDLFEEDCKLRDAFHSEHGRYLPATLCPAIQEPATRFTILPEQIVSELPLLSPSSEEDGVQSPLLSSLNNSALQTEDAAAVSQETL